MIDKQQPCVFLQQTEENVLLLQGDLDIYHAQNLQQQLLQAIECKAPLRVDMSKLNELDLTIIQLLFSAKITAQQQNSTFTIAPVSISAQDILVGYGMATDLLC